MGTPLWVSLYKDLGCGSLYWGPLISGNNYAGLTPIIRAWPRALCAGSMESNTEVAQG